MTYRHDSIFTVKYLKAAQLAIQKKIAGQPFLSLREIEPDLPLPRLSKSGLPIIIGTRDRRAICSGSPRIIQLYLSLFGLYRAISADVKPKLDTITQPFSGSVPFMLSASDWFRFNSKAILSRTMRVPVPYLEVDAPILLEKASPSSDKSWKGLVSDAVALTYFPEVFQAMKTWLSWTNSFRMKRYLEILSLKTCPINLKSSNLVSAALDAGGFPSSQFGW